MTCGACEARVTKLLRSIPGVQDARVSLNRGTATLIAAAPVPTERIDAALDAAGYRVGASALPLISRDRGVWRDVALAAVAMGLLVAGAGALGLDRLTDRMAIGVSPQGLAVVLALGIIASLSTCMALVGGLVLSLAARFARTHPNWPTGRRLRPQAMFNAGRVVGFAALGAALGAVGSAVSVNARVLALLTLAAAAIMGTIGLKLTGVSPRVARASLTLPARWSRWTDRLQASRGYRDSTALLLGAGSFFLPCGFTQAVQVYAFSTGSPSQASLVMGVFALGTAPGLFGVGALGSLVSGRAAAHIFRATGVAVLTFALVNTIGAARLLVPGLGQPVSSVTASARTDNVTDDAGVQVLTTVQHGGGYEPTVSVVYVGRPVRWEIDSWGTSCASSMNLEAMGLGLINLDVGLNVVEFTPTEPGTLPYTCGMGMFPASIEAILDPAGIEPVSPTPPAQGDAS
jgi:sulfite exporter TauE/SafE/copper chaperone CopZ